MKELTLHLYIDPQQRSHWPSHDVVFFDHKNFKLYQTNALGKFCEELGYTLTKLSALSTGRIKSHKGLTVWTHGKVSNIITHSL